MGKVCVGRGDQREGGVRGGAEGNNGAWAKRISACNPTAAAGLTFPALHVHSKNPKLEQARTHWSGEYDPYCRVTWMMLQHMMPPSMGWQGLAQHSTAQHSTAQRSAAQNSSALCRKAQLCSAVQVQVITCHCMGQDMALSAGQS